ncbi:hypothetical protein Moror_11144 [Moniliophthora roreri MCA 2997]|uniref:Uncharacterized protein n=1 Tax=Moniliophthora roreri (strain MCA 2997) TaxID=1381753 RepID=V2WJ27_MONRO|nr:hypothetical protein Moror_11144 [Moniliophthora roreri MCA 2997]
MASSSNACFLYSTLTFVRQGASEPESDMQPPKKRRRDGSEAGPDPKDTSKDGESQPLQRSEFSSYLPTTNDGEVDEEERAGNDKYEEADQRRRKRVASKQGGDKRKKDKEPALFKLKRESVLECARSLDPNLCGLPIDEPTDRAAFVFAMDGLSPPSTPLCLLSPSIRTELLQRLHQVRVAVTLFPAIVNLFCGLVTIEAGSAIGPAEENFSGFLVYTIGGLNVILGELKPRFNYIESLVQVVMGMLATQKSNQARGISAPVYGILTNVEYFLFLSLDRDGDGAFQIMAEFDLRMMDWDNRARDIAAPHNTALFLECHGGQITGQELGEDKATLPTRDSTTWWEKTDLALQEAELQLQSDPVLQPHAAAAGIKQIEATISILEEQKLLPGWQKLRDRREHLAIARSCVQRYDRLQHCKLKLSRLLSRTTVTDLRFNVDDGVIVAYPDLDSWSLSLGVSDEVRSWISSKIKSLQNIGSLVSDIREDEKAEGLLLGDVLALRSAVSRHAGQDLELEDPFLMNREQLSTSDLLLKGAPPRVQAKLDAQRVTQLAAPSQSGVECGTL